MTNEIAATIRDQIGGRAFAMMGASNLVAGERSLTWKLGRNAAKATHVRVTLEPTDLYRVEILKVSARAATPVATIRDASGIYADQLRGVIEKATGLYLSL